MSDPKRDWDRELAEIDRMIQGQQAPAAPPQAPARGAPRAQPAGGTGGAARPALPPARGSTRGAWLAALVAVLASVGMTQWPWAYACGAAFLAHLAASVGLVMVGAWAALVSWRRHAGVPHLLSLLTVAWGAVLVALDVVPASTWRCG